MGVKMKWIALVSRLALAAIFLYAGYVKLKAPWFVFASNIDSYRLLPSQATIFLAKTLPAFELVLGVLLLIGVWVRWVSIVCGLLLLGFWTAMLQAFLRGMNIDCGCFGPGEAVSVKTLIRDAGMWILAALVWWAARPNPVQPTLSAPPGSSAH